MDDTSKQIAYLATALKAPRIRDTAARLAAQAREAGWSHEDYLAAVLDREVSAPNASGAELRIRGAGFPAREPSRSSSSTTSLGFGVTTSPRWPRAIT